MTVQTVPISPLVMLRLPLLANPEHPNGQLQLYTGIGPGFFVKDTTASLVSGGGRVSEQTMSIGVDFRAGVAYEFLPNWAVFGEYRFTHYSVSGDGRINGQRTTVDVDVDANHVLFGISYRFR